MHCFNFFKQTGMKKLNRIKNVYFPQNSAKYLKGHFIQALMIKQADGNCGHIWADHPPHWKPPRPQSDSNPAWLWDLLHPAVLIENRNKRKGTICPITLSLGYQGNPTHPAQRWLLLRKENKSVMLGLSERRIARGQI